MAWVKPQRKQDIFQEKQFCASEAGADLSEGPAPANEDEDSLYALSGLYLVVGKPDNTPKDLKGKPLILCGNGMGNYRVVNG